MESRASKNAPPALRQGHALTRTIRAADWWEFKLSPIFAGVYATAYFLDVSIASLWPTLLLALAALVPGAAYVSVLNDLTDMEDDLASGKTNRLVGKSRTFIAGVLACCVVPGMAVAFYWRGDPLLLSLYLAAWAAFTLYSVRPVRLKERGAWGLLADASGAHLFPTLVAVVLVFRRAGAPLDAVWLAAAATWALGLGLRGNLWHQLSDRHNDEKIGLRTFARRHKITRLRRLGNFVIFPVEAVGFALLLARVGSVATLVALGLYALLERWRKGFWKMRLVVVVPAERSSILLLEYYEVFFPLVLLLSSALRHPLDALVAAAHLLLFPRRASQCLKDTLKLFKQRAAMLLR